MRTCAHTSYVLGMIIMKPKVGAIGVLASILIWISSYTAYLKLRSRCDVSAFLSASEGLPG